MTEGTQVKTLKKERAGSQNRLLTKSALKCRDTRSIPAEKGGAELPRFLNVVNMSGGTGRTAEQVINASLAQFEDPQVHVVRRANIQSKREARQIVRDAAKTNAVIVHTLVSPEIRRAVIQEAESRMVPTVDILGPVINALSDHLQLTPKNEPGLSYKLRKEQFDRIDSVDFTLAHDDGARLKSIAGADVVLVGVSRVAKSVTCFYLAYRGIKAANVPIVLNSELPVELTQLNPERVVGLTMNPERLLAIRSARIGSMGYGHVADYSDRRLVQEELRYAAHLMDKYKWKCIDVSYLGIEEVATEVLKLIKFK